MTRVSPVSGCAGSELNERAVELCLLHDTICSNMQIRGEYLNLTQTPKSLDDVFAVPDLSTMDLVDVIFRINIASNSYFAQFGGFIFAVGERIHLDKVIEDKNTEASSVEQLRKIRQQQVDDVLIFQKEVQPLFIKLLQRVEADAADLGIVNQELQAVLASAAQLAARAQADIDSLGLVEGVRMEPVVTKHIVLTGL